MTTLSGSVTRSEPAARLAHDLSTRHCQGCADYHGIWPYLRLIDPPRGVDADRDHLISVLDPLLQPGTSVLLAGSADAGLAECLLDAAADRPIELTILDLCQTPLRQSLALLDGRAPGRILTRQGSITGDPVSPAVDLIVAHSVLSFLAPQDLPAATRFIGQSLKPGGHLVMTTGLGAKSKPSNPLARRRNIMDQLAARHVPLPVDAATFTASLDAYLAGRARRTYPFADQQGLRHWLAVAGLSPTLILSQRRGTGLGADGLPAGQLSDGVMVVACKDVPG